MFFFGPKVLLLLKRHSLEIYYTKSDKVMEVPFHSSAVRHLEVASREEVIKTLVESFKDANLGKQTAVIALSDHIIFDRLISEKNATDPQKELADFYHNVPLDETHIAKKIMPLKGAVLALAVNRELFNLVMQVAEEFEWKIKAVVPMTPFAKVAEDEKLTPDQVNQVLRAKDIFKEADFLNESVLAVDPAAKKVKKEDDEEEEEKEEEGDDETEKKTSPLLTVVIALFLLSLIIGSLFFFKIIPLPNIPFINPAPTPAASAVPEATASAQPESTSSANTQEATIAAELNRDEVRIHVLNGSGISGQAAKLKEKLGEVGYKNVITGNIESSEASESSVVYSKNLDNSIKEEINKLIDSLVEGVTKADEAINEFNAVITLGKLEREIE